ncbi:Arm DNA-binding domain-containing protein [Chromobacterium sp. IIBBL 290-4]|uniref:Arm DNA-binding domain-containing protein n=1 Tax=Chromobacterium sp. IIBBL 290-4 TaxID=2953890 RepID=UPI003531BD5C
MNQTASKSVVYHYDSDAPGLGVRVTASGVKSYIFQSYIHHKQFRMTIGDVSAWRLNAPARSTENSARKEARRSPEMLAEAQRVEVIPTKRPTVMETLYLEQGRNRSGVQIPNPATGQSGAPGSRHSDADV